MLIASVSGVTEFVDLSDTPSNYTGAAGKGLKINLTETGVEFATLTDTDQFTELTDTPDSYIGFSGYTVGVGASGLTFTEINQAITGLTDVSITDYTAGQLLRSNGTGFTGITDSDYYVTLVDDQVITGEKTFTGETIFQDGIDLTNPLKFSGTG